MSNAFPLRRRSIEVVRQTNFEPTEDGGGLIVFDGWDNSFKVEDRDDFHLRIAVSWYVVGETLPDSVLLEFVNPDLDALGISAVALRRVLLFDDTGTLSSFVEDNLGTWWIVPQRSKRDLPYQLQFTTTGDDGITMGLMVDVAWFPNWPCPGVDAAVRKAIGG